MRLLKRTYKLPSDALRQFEQEVTPDNRSVVIAGLLREWTDKQRQEQLRREVIEGCREMSDVYLKVEGEYHALEEEVHRGLDAQSQTRGHRTRSTRPRRRV